MLALSPTWRAVLVVIIVACCLVALSITQYLMGIHDPLKVAAATGAGSVWADLCKPSDADQGAGCEEVVTSKFGYIGIPWPTAVAGRPSADDEGSANAVSTKWVAHPVPVAQLGQCYYLFMLVWFLSTGVPARSSRWWHLLPLLLSVAAVLASVVYIWIMATQLDGWCRLCFTLHLLDFAICPCVVLLWPTRRQLAPAAAGQERVDGRDRDRAPVEIVRLGHRLVTLALVAALMWVSFQHRFDENQTARALRELSGVKKQLERIKTDAGLLAGAYAGTEAVDIPPRSTQSARGSAQAAHELVLFSDLQCPVCRTFENWFYENVWGLWQGQLRVVFRHFPLCTHCNPSQKSSPARPAGLHPQACAAAFAAEAARLQGGAAAFWKMHGAILQRQHDLKKPGFDPSRFSAYAEEIGLDGQRLAQDMAGAAVKEAVQTDVQTALRLQVNATPTVFLDGKKLASIQRGSIEFWKEVAGQALAGGASESFAERGTSP